MITPAQCRAARGLLNWSQQRLADAATVGVVTIRQFENEAASPRNATLSVVVRAFEAAGVIFVEENGDGPGVRLRKTGEAGRAHALQKAEETVDRRLAEVDAHPKVKAKRKRIVTQLAKDLATEPKK